MDQVNLIFEKLKGNFHKLSTTDYSSNAMEKFFEWYPENLASIYIDEILSENKLLGILNLYFRYNEK